ncbi:MAG: Glutathione S-transferase family protein, partial [uncultured Acetobacteraceae bacterium]
VPPDQRRAEPLRAQGPHRPGGEGHPLRAPDGGALGLHHGDARLQPAGEAARAGAAGRARRLRIALHPGMAGSQAPGTAAPARRRRRRARRPAGGGHRRRRLRRAGAALLGAAPAGRTAQRSLDGEAAAQGGRRPARPCGDGGSAGRRARLARGRALRPRRHRRRLRARLPGCPLQRASLAGLASRAGAAGRPLGGAPLLPGNGADAAANRGPRGV